MRFFLLIILLALPAFFNAGEVAVIRVRPSKAQRLVEEGQNGSKSILRLQRRLRRALVVSQLGISLSLISIGWICNSLAAQWWSHDQISNRSWELFFFLGIVLLTTLLAITMKQL